MGSINTEEAARRLARVILSDIELYNRERPKQGESLEAQIEEGRRLFASRVAPDLLPLFSLVLSDRAPGGVKSPAAAERPSTRASTAAAFDPAAASPASNSTVQDPPTPAPSIAAPSLQDHLTPATAFAAPPRVDQPALIAQARTAAPPAYEIPIPVLTARFSIPRLLGIVSVAAATVAVLYLLLH